MLRATTTTLAVAALWLWGGMTLWAQPVPATLVADRVSFNRGDSSLTAEGNVEILREGTRLTARRIHYNGLTDRIEVEGPITIRDADGTVILGEFGELSTDLQEGVLEGARMVLDRQMQIAAAKIERADGRYTRLTHSVASSCRVCAGGQTPIWQIRAKSVIHDNVRHELRFENARFEVYGVPVLYVPRLRLPDPTVKRRTGFLTPRFRITDNLGSGIKLPYFITLGDHADLTLTPYVTTDNSYTMEAAFRKRFRNGDLNFRGAITSDDLTNQQVRGYIFLDGWFDVGDGFKATFDIEAVSDPGYLLEYGYSDKDRLDSSFRLARTRRDEHVEGEVTFFHSLRDSEINKNIPTLVSDASYIRRFTPGAIGGMASLTLETHAQHRESNVNGALGRDVERTSLRGDWRRNWQVPNGMLVSTLGSLQADIYGVHQDTAFQSTETRVTPYGGVELRWPLVRQGAHASHVIEPVAQLVWSPDSGNAVPNEDSLLVEFDETNLFSMSRFSGSDAVERGLRANLGIGYTRYAPAGWSLGVAAGRVVRAEDLHQFTPQSGLSGTSSDWVASARIAASPGISLTNRAVFSDGLSVTKAEMRLGYHTYRTDFSSTYVWLDADPAELRPKNLSEWSFDMAYDMENNWSARSNWRYDAVADKTTRAGVGMRYQNECISVDLGITRRFTTSTDVRPSTDFSLSIALAGVGNSGSGSPNSHRCRG